MEQNKNHVVYFDYLRVFATLAVIFLHSASQNWLNTDIHSAKWSIFNVYNSLARWGVPCFVMISGALFLPRSIEVKKIFGKYILRMVIAYFVWSFIYAVFFPALRLIFVDGYSFPVKSIIDSTLRGPFHMWFVPMIVGLYMSIPFLQPIARNLKTARYFLLLSLIFAFVLPELSSLTEHFGSIFVNSLMDCVNSVISDMRFHMVLGYAGYFILGYCLSRHEMKASHRYIVYLLGVAGTLVTIVLSAAASRRLVAPVESYYQNLTVNVLMQAVAVFTLFKSVLKHAKPRRWLTVLSKCSFGAYLVHILIMKVLNVLGLNSLSFHPALSVPVISAISAVLSFAISYVINRIPVLNKYIV